MGPKPRPSVLDVDLYVPGDSKASAARVFKLSSNENPLGASPSAVTAFAQSAGHLAGYPDGSGQVLRRAIADRYGLDPARIILGAGSDEIFQMVARVYLDAADEALYTRHGFLVYEIVTKLAGATAVVAPETNLTADVDALLAAVTTRTKVVFLANPNNPTGTYLPIADVRRLHQGLPEDVLLVLDGAYAEYVERNDYEAGLELAAESQNVLMTRTFSKIHGLAALRIGWAYGPRPIIDALNRARGPFNLSTPALLAGAAAIADTRFVQDSVAHNSRGLAAVSAAAERLQLLAAPSVGNFVLVRFPETPGKSATDADAFFRARGLVTRAMKSYHLPDCLRISIGTDEANGLMITALNDFMAS